MVVTTGSDGLRREWAVTPMAAADGFDITHTLTNDGDQPWRGALWALTCVEPLGEIVSPCADAEIVFIDIPSDVGACEQWLRREGFAVTTPLGLRGKAGWHSEGGWLALLRPDVTFMIHSPDASSGKPVVHPACNVEVFVCRDYLEMETLGAETLLTPGERTTHQQSWLLLPGGLLPRQWGSLASLIKEPASLSYAC
jgi:hypothetical protein